MTSSAYPKKSRRENFIQLAGLIGFLAVLFGIINATDIFETPASSSHRVTYRIDGSTSAAVVSYTLQDGSASKRFDTTLPWEKTLTFDQTTTVVVIAGNPSQTGSLRCKLSVDGVEYDFEEVAAPGDRVSCAGVTP